MQAVERLEGGGALAPADSEPSALAAYLGTLAPSSQQATRWALRRAALLLGDDGWRVVPWHRLRHQHVAELRRRLEGSCSPATANASLAAVKGVLKSAWKLGQIDGDDYARAVDVRGVPGTRLPAGRALAGGESAALLNAAGEGPTLAIRLRDRAMIALLAGAGLRRAEAVGLDAHDYADGVVTVVGKGGKQRRAHLLAGCAEIVDAWLSLRTDVPGPLLRRVTRDGEIEDAGMKPAAVVSRLAMLSKRAGIERVTPHDLRRTYATALLDGGVDVIAVQRLMGHEKAETTARYDRRPDRAAAEAAASVALVSVQPA